MVERVRLAFAEWLSDESGQSITEYAYIIAFVGVLIAFAFNLARGGFFASVTQAFSNCTSGLSTLNYTVNSTGT